MTGLEGLNELNPAEGKEFEDQFGGVSPSTAPKLDYPTMEKVVMKAYVQSRLILALNPNMNTLFSLDNFMELLQKHEGLKSRDQDGRFDPVAFLRLFFANISNTMYDAIKGGSVDRTNGTALLRLIDHHTSCLNLSQDIKDKLKAANLSNRFIFRADLYTFCVELIYRDMTTQPETLFNYLFADIAYLIKNLNEIYAFVQRLNQWYSTVILRAAEEQKAFRLYLRVRGPGSLRYQMSRFGDAAPTYVALKHSPYAYDLRNPALGEESHSIPMKEHIASVNISSNEAISSPEQAGPSKRQFRRDKIMTESRDPMYTTVYGPFDRVFGSSDDANDDIAKKCHHISNALKTNRDCFVLGLGASGSGKSSSLLYLRTPQGAQNGVLVSIVGAVVKPKEIVKVTIHEYYVSDDAKKQSDPSMSADEMSASALHFKRERCQNVEFVKTDSNELKLRQNFVAQLELPMDERGRSIYFDTKSAGTTIGEFIVYFVDDYRMRRIMSTMNNPASSRSHILITIQFPGGNNLFVADLAGIESKFDCDNISHMIALANIVSTVNGPRHFYTPEVYRTDLERGAAKVCVSATEEVPPIDQLMESEQSPFSQFNVYYPSDNNVMFMDETNNVNIGSPFMYGHVSTKELDRKKMKPIVSVVESLKYFDVGPDNNPRLSSDILNEIKNSNKKKSTLSIYELYYLTKVNNMGHLMSRLRITAIPAYTPPSKYGPKYTTTDTVVDVRDDPDPKTVSLLSNHACEARSYCKILGIDFYGNSARDMITDLDWLHAVQTHVLDDTTWIDMSMGNLIVDYTKDHKNLNNIKEANSVSIYTCDKVKRPLVFNALAIRNVAALLATIYMANTPTIEQTKVHVRNIDTSKIQKDVSSEDKARVFNMLFSNVYPSLTHISSPAMFMGAMFKYVDTPSMVNEVGWNLFCQYLCSSLHAPDIKGDEDGFTDRRCMDSDVRRRKTFKWLTQMMIKKMRYWIDAGRRVVSMHYVCKCRNVEGDHIRATLQLTNNFLYKLVKEKMRTRMRYDSTIRLDKCNALSTTVVLPSLIPQNNGLGDEPGPATHEQIIKYVKDNSDISTLEIVVFAVMRNDGDFVDKPPRTAYINTNELMLEKLRLQYEEVVAKIVDTISDSSGTGIKSYLRYMNYNDAVTKKSLGLKNKYDELVSVCLQYKTWLNYYNNGTPPLSVPSNGVERGLSAQKYKELVIRVDAVLDACKKGNPLEPLKNLLKEQVTINSTTAVGVLDQLDSMAKNTFDVSNHATCSTSPIYILSYDKPTAGQKIDISNYTPL